MKSGHLYFLEPSGPIQACNGTALPFTFRVGSHSFFKALLELHAQRRMDTIQTPCVKALLQNTSNRNNFNQWPITPLAVPSWPQLKWWCDTVCRRNACKSDMPDPVTNVGRSTWLDARASPPLELLWPFLYIFCWPCILLGFLVNNQLDAQSFSMCLFQFSTCFEQPRAHHQKNQLYQCNIWYISLCRWPFRVHTKRLLETCGEVK